jgi:hypothetical protein
MYDWKLVRFRLKPRDCPCKIVVDDAGTASKLKSAAVDRDHTLVLVASAWNEKVTEVVRVLGMCPDSENSRRNPVMASL